MISLGLRLVLDTDVVIAALRSPKGASAALTLTADPRAPQQAVGSSRIASAYYATPGFTIDVNFTDGAAHQVALYLLDWDGGGRSETIEVVDAANPATVLSTQTANGFTGGTYLVWSVTGHVKFQVNALTGANAVVSGLFVQ